MAKYLQSRKFWAALLGFIVAGVLFIKGMIDAEQFITATLVLVGVFVGGNTAEDVATKLAGKAPGEDSNGAAG